MEQLKFSELAQFKVKFRFISFFLVVAKSDKVQANVTFILFEPRKYHPCRMYIFEYDCSKHPNCRDIRFHGHLLVN